MLWPFYASSSGPDYSRGYANEGYCASMSFSHNEYLYLILPRKKSTIESQTCRSDRGETTDRTQSNARTRTRGPGRINTGIADTDTHSSHKHTLLSEEEKGK